MSPSPEFTPLPPFRGHESDDVRRRWVVVGVAALVATLVASFVLVSLLVRWDESLPRAADRARSAIDGTRLADDAPPLQPSLRHDASPNEDLALMRRHEDAAFESLGWRVDPKTGLPAIPDGAIAAARPRVATTTAVAAAASRPAITPVPGVDEGGAQ